MAVMSCNGCTAVRGANPNLKKKKKLTRKTLKSNSRERERERERGRERERERNHTAETAQHGVARDSSTISWQPV